MSAPNLYDECPYPGAAYPQTHPDRLAAIATLMGMSPAPAERARVLEIGCGDGFNLLGMAAALPGSAFVGIDLAGRPIASGQRAAERLGLSNLRLLEMDLLDLPPGLGPFDYIVAHGFYAWVPAPVRDKLLEVCRDRLAPQGVAYVSYAAYPGGRLQEMFRDMMLYHVRGLDRPSDQIAQSRALLDLLRHAESGREETARWLAEQSQRMLARLPATLLHDELAPHYGPVYFHQFVDHASRFDLEYLAEADYFEMNDAVFPPECVEVLRRFGPDETVQKEQYMDFLKVRSFRQTLLCHRAVRLRRDPASADLSRFHVTTRAHPVPGAPGGGPQEYRTPKGASMATDDPVVRRIMDRLVAAWPRSVALGELGPPAEVGPIVLELYGSSIVDLSLTPARFAGRAGERPEVPRSIRLQAELSPTVTNLRHTDVRIDGDLARALLGKLDGTRDRAGLLKELSQTDPSLTPERLEQGLEALARLALLVA